MSATTAPEARRMLGDRDRQVRPVVARIDDHVPEVPLVGPRAG